MSVYKIVVCGSRGWTDRAAIRAALDNASHGQSRMCVVIHGAAKGADRIAAEEAEALGYGVEACPADWEKYGRAAGFRRNIEMLDKNPHVVLAFWDGESKGTKHTIDNARKRRIPVEVHYP